VSSEAPSERELETLKKICDVWEKLGKSYRDILEAWNPRGPDQLTWKQRMLRGLDLLGK
jgi:hypothetical protein